LKVEFIDANDNRAEEIINISIGQLVTAKIISPNYRAYYRSEFTKLNVSVNPPKSDIEIFIDNKKAKNLSKINLINYSLGEHTVRVLFKGKEIAKSTFTVTTDLNDLSKTVNKLYLSREINYYCLYRNILLRIKTAQTFYRFKLTAMGNRTLDSLISLINSRSKGRRPQISEYAKNIIFEAIEFNKK